MPTLQTAFLKVVDRTANRLHPFGFTRWGLVMRLMAEGNAAIVSFQKSIYADADQLEFTINLSIVCGRLWTQEARPLSLAREVDGHLQERIGFLLDEPDDVWWSIEPGTDGDRLADEVSDLVATSAVPYLRQYLTTEALIELWASGESPGMTNIQRERFLRQLRS